MKKNSNILGFFILVTIAGMVLVFLKEYHRIHTISEAIDTIEVVQNINSEKCLQCHSDVKGFSPYHNPEVIGCTSCHLGNTNSLDKKEAHKGMVLIPGNLSDAKNTCGKCHATELHKIENSLMTSNSGLIAVDKYIFGEADSPNYQYHIKLIKNTPSEKHVRDLCANCHLGSEKDVLGPINQLSRGGGCNACHLNYSVEAEKDLHSYLSSNKKELLKFHPSTTINVTNEHCFGCHSRSSRISTNYMGLQETLFNVEHTLKNKNFWVLEDGRVYAKKENDIHHSKGMLCIDCHSSHEVMGEGKQYIHAEDAVKIQCSDCHFKNKPNTINYKNLDQESLMVFMHRNYSHSNKKMIAVKKDNHPLINTFIDSLGNAFLIGKKDGVIHTLKPQSKTCSRDMAHKNVSCSSCHSSWTSRCIGCHNQFDKNETRAFDLLDKKFVKGQWKEYVSEFSSSLPALGVREKNGKMEIEPAIPGMILTIDKGSFSDKKIGTDVSFHRLYAPNSPHTTTKKVRDCKSCHSNPATLGYGNGDLTYKILNGKGKWEFIPDYVLNVYDNLPEDAWIPFLKNVKPGTINSTRTDFRPFTVKEQQNLLLVGACLQCHKEDSKVMKQSLVIGLKPLLKKINKKCILPTYN